ncbi:hypothetical protein THAOC_22528 [Thalassiosira oceanica]|uniref:Uncharacterized protein n=1 Tax=Thalassiosira oceanica TaxID=159749 RepID=K0RU92_THAOC|nr:hypothetical protein THAOC_22528 [Thalassiosira oceanica]|eukprot:EJK57428.1 hypothetical protein THAOC_22528 [Thalassiosira oceanica]
MARLQIRTEEYAPKLYYVPGEDNILADTFSRLPRLGDDSVQPIELDDCYLGEDGFFSMMDDPELGDCFLNLPELNDPAENPPQLHVHQGLPVGMPSACKSNG